MEGGQRPSIGESETEHGDHCGPIAEGPVVHETWRYTLTLNWIDLSAKLHESCDLYLKSRVIHLSLLFYSHSHSFWSISHLKVLRGKQLLFFSTILFYKRIETLGKSFTRGMLLSQWGGQLLRIPQPSLMNWAHWRARAMNSTRLVSAATSSRVQLMFKVKPKLQMISWQKHCKKRSYRKRILTFNEIDVLYEFSWWRKTLWRPKPLSPGVNDGHLASRKTVSSD